MSDHGSIIRAGSPLFLVTSTHRCRCCNQEVEVIGLAARFIWDDEDPADPNEEFEACMLSVIERMPQEILEDITRSYPRYGMHWSEVFETNCLSNRCECGVWFENFDLHHDVGAAFFPLCPQDARRMVLRQLPVTGYYEFKCRYAWGAGLFTFAWARRLPFVS
jgi:hypothetical protein